MPYLDYLGRKLLELATEAHSTVIYSTWISLLWISLLIAATSQEVYLL